MTRRLAASLSRPCAAAAALLLAGCVELQSALHPRGEAAERIATLWWVLLAVGGVVVVVVTALLVAGIRHDGGPARRGRRGHPADVPVDLRGVPGTPADAAEAEAGERGGMRWILVGGVAVPAVVLAGVFVYTVGVLRALAPEREPAAMDVEVVGHQWWWEVRYLDSIPANVVRSANELHVPVGQRVRVRLRASDVIHSFWVPQLAGKLDLVPGRENVTWIKADTAGVFRGQCAEYCGLQHANMGFLVVAHPPDEFRAWLARERQPAAEPPPEDTLARLGRRLFEERSCVVCHGVRGIRAGASVGPDLTHVASRRTLAAGTLRNVRGNLAGWIADPHGVKPGTRMPRTYLPPHELHAIVAYLETLR